MLLSFAMENWDATEFIRRVKSGTYGGRLNHEFDQLSLDQLREVALLITSGSGRYVTESDVSEELTFHISQPECEPRALIYAIR